MDDLGLPLVFPFLVREWPFWERRALGPPLALNFLARLVVFAILMRYLMCGDCGVLRYSTSDVELL